MCGRKKQKSPVTQGLAGLLGCRLGHLWMLKNTFLAEEESDNTDAA